MTTAERILETAERILETAERILEQQEGDAIRISLVRAKMSDVSRPELDESLVDLFLGGSIILSRDDNARNLTNSERASALIVGDSERHLFYVRR